MSEKVYIVDGKRIPQCKAGAELKDVPPPFLLSGLLRHLLSTQGIPMEDVDEVVVGNAGAPASFANIARIAALEAGIPFSVPAYTVHRNCASGMEALAQAFLKISQGQAHVMLAGGVESMSQMPLYYGPAMTTFFTSLNKAKTLGEKLKVFASFRLHFLKPVVAIEQGLTDSYCGLNMGQTAELLARELHISREEQDFFANESHQKAVKAIQNGFFQQEIMPFLQGKKGDKILPTDSGPRAQSTIQSLAKLRPYFEKETGTVTVGNSCPLTDGASACLMVSEEALKKYKLTPLAILKDITFAGLDPKRMGLGPVVATQKICRKSNISLSDVDLFEINEAFAAQVLACLKIFKHKELALKMGLSQDFLQEIPSEKLNIHGGAIALGHPIGSTGSRLVVTLMHALKQKKLKTGIASLCIGGGQGGAALVEMI